MDVLCVANFYSLPLTQKLCMFSIIIIDVSDFYHFHCYYDGLEEMMFMTTLLHRDNYMTLDSQN